MIKNVRLGVRKLLRKVVSGIMMTLLLIGVLPLTLSIQPVKAEPTTIIVPHDYPTIKEAIEAANAGDTIIVSAGYYAEGQIIVNKPLSLIADGYVLVDGPEILLQSAFYVTSDNVTIKGFIIRRSHNGIRLGDVDWCVIEGNSLIRNYDSISSWAFGDHNIIRENRITTFEQYAIALRGSASFNVIEENEIIGTLISEEPGFFGGIYLDWDFSQNTICYNTISLETTPPRGAGIWLNRYSSQNDVSYNSISGGSIGIYIWGSDHNIVERNIVEDTRTGIGLGDSSGNIIRRNTLRNINKCYLMRACAINLHYGGNYQNIVEKNFILGSYDGIFIEESCYTDICDNVILNGAGYGLAVTANSNYTTIQKNVVLINQQFDLYWDQTGTGNTWTKNKYLTKNW